MNRNDEIDRLRAIAALLIVWLHVPRYLFPEIGSWPAWIDQTWVGVDLFFVISGFVVTGTLIPAIKRPSTVRSIIAFYIRRLLRLLPVCWLWFISASAVLLFTQGGPHLASVRSLLSEAASVATYSYNIFYLKAQSPWLLGWHWSLSIEEQFYLFFPMLLVILKNNRRRLVVFAVAFLAVAVVVRPLQSAGLRMGNYDIRYSSILALDRFLAGAILMIVLSGSRLKAPKTGSFAMILLSTLLIACLPIVPAVLDQAPAEGFLVLTAVSTGLIYLAARFQNVILPVPGLRGVLLWLGRRSYSLYLIHIPAFWLVRHGVVKGWLNPESRVLIAVIAAALMGLLLELSYRLVESPMTQWGKRLAAGYQAGERRQRRRVTRTPSRAAATS